MTAGDQPEPERGAVAVWRPHDLWHAIVSAEGEAPTSDHFVRFNVAVEDHAHPGLRPITSARYRAIRPVAYADGGNTPRCRMS
jgi:hypothetical protein